MQAVFRQIHSYARHFRSLLIVGETGTGKELVAQAIHRLSGRKPLVVCNCAALPDGLLENELFGHTRGAFTGAVSDAAGVFEQANGGTVFLDEIGELPLAAQAKLLRALQNGEVQKVGGAVPRKVDARVIAATNRNLSELVRGRDFREDLYYRISLFEIRLPSLSSRHGDVELLIEYFLDNFRKKYDRPLLRLSPGARACLEQYHWPGNVRQLEGAVEHGCVVCDGDWIGVEHLPCALAGAKPQRENNVVPVATQDTASFRPVDEMVREYTLTVLRAVEGNRTKAADILGIGRTTLYRILQNAHEEPVADPAGGEARITVLARGDGNRVNLERIRGA
jgi:transcriptional regulator with PAS, ATPase and Fis domain